MPPADAVLLVEWPERAGPNAWPEALALTLDVGQDGDEKLDSGGAAGMGRAMAAHDDSAGAAPDFLAACGWGGAEILPLAGDASFRRYFRVVARRAQRGADGRAAAARGSAAVPRGRRMARRDGASRAGDPCARSRPGAAAARGFRRRAAARDARRGPAARARAVRARDRRAGPSARPPADGRAAAARARAVARRSSKLFTEWYCPAVGADVDERALSARVARSARAGRGRWPRAGDGAARLSCREHHAGRGPRRGRPFRPARFPGRAGGPSGL